MTDQAAAKILLAEDDNDMRRFLVKALQHAGFSVTSFDNGLAGFECARYNGGLQRRDNALLLRNGFKFFEFRAQYSTVPYHPS